MQKRNDNQNESPRPISAEEVVATMDTPAPMTIDRDGVVLCRDGRTLSVHSCRSPVRTERYRECAVHAVNAHDRLVHALLWLHDGLAGESQSAAEHNNHTPGVGRTVPYRPEHWREVAAISEAPDLARAVVWPVEERTPIMACDKCKTLMVVREDGSPRCAMCKIAEGQQR